VTEERQVFETLGVESEAHRLLAAYKDEAVRCLEPLDGAALKGLLRRVIFRIFHDSARGASLGESGVGHASARAGRTGPAA
jgi:hypothetical protein